MGILFKKTNLFVLTVLTCSMTLFSSGDRELVEINRIVAKVNDRIITWGEIERKMDHLNFSEKEKKKRADEFVNGEIDKFLSIDAFAEQGMAIPDAYIEQEYNKKLLENFNGDRRLFRDVLQGNGQSQLEYRDQIKENIIHMHMLAKRKRSREEISPVKVEQFYLDNQVRFQTEREIRIGEVILSVSKNTQTVEELRVKAEMLRDKMGSLDDFKQIASEIGTSYFKDKAGDWGVMVKRSELRNPTIRDQAFALKKGEISKPFPVSLLVRMDDGKIENSGKSAYYILALLDERPAGLKPLDEVRFEIEKILASQIESHEQGKWFAKRKRDAYVTIDLPE